MKPVRIYLSFLLLLLFCQDALSQVIDNGKWYTKTFSNSFSIQVRPAITGTHADVVLLYKTQPIITQTLTETDSVTVIDGRWNTAVVTGRIRLKPGSRNRTTTLDATLKLADGNLSEQFNGQLAAWRNDTPDSAQQVYELGPVCTVKTTISGDNRDIATITFYYVNTLLYSLTLTSVMPSAVIPEELTIGRLSIYKGAKLELQVPSRLQTGFVMLSCTIKSDDHDPAVFSAQVAHWSLIP